MDWRERIHADAGIMGGKPVVRGSRITVELILEYFEDGATIADVLLAFDHLVEQDIRAALAFARDAVAHTTIWKHRKRLNQWTFLPTRINTRLS